MNKIYISGPMRDNKIYKYKNYNYDAFIKAAIELRESNWIVISPAEITLLFEGWKKYPPKGFKPSYQEVKDIIRQDLNAIFELDETDAIYMLKNWEYSIGAKVEKALAECLGLKIYYE